MTRGPAGAMAARVKGMARGKGAARGEGAARGKGMARSKGAARGEGAARRAACMAALVAAFAYAMAPFALLVLNSLKAKRDIVADPFALVGRLGLSFANYASAFQKMGFPKAFANSLLVTLASVAASAVLSSMAAYHFARSRSALSKGAFAVMTASMTVPFQALMIPLVSIYGAGLGLMNHRATLVFLHAGFSMGMTTFLYHGFVRSSVPAALEEAARIDGCSRARAFFAIVFPLLRPITATACILNALAFWNDYLLPSLVLSERSLLTLPLSTYAFYGTYATDYGALMAGLVLSAAPILALFLLLQRHVVSGVTAGAVKS
jgi:raffinose/stachyose/melibiose transport system permease protein